MRHFNWRWCFNSRSEFWEWIAFASVLAGMAIVGVGIIHTPH